MQIEYHYSSVHYDKESVMDWWQQEREAGTAHVSAYQEKRSANICFPLFIQLWSLTRGMKLAAFKMVFLSLVTTL